MLDRTQPDYDDDDDVGALPLAPMSDAPSAGPAARGWSKPVDWIKRAGRYFAALTFSSLTRRIVFLNLIGLFAMLAGILYLSQFRAGLIDARAQSLLVQAEIISGAIAASA
ncbi:MAG TPA: sensor N-terminal transmembrane domain-containing protein, partial [Afipia sp.]